MGCNDDISSTSMGMPVSRSMGLAPGFAFIDLKNSGGCVRLATCSSCATLTSGRVHRRHVIIVIAPAQQQQLVGQRTGHGNALWHWRREPF
jgi:hypothetical protein